MTGNHSVERDGNREVKKDKGCRSRRVGILLIGIVLLSLGDLALTLTHLKTIGMIEANPIAAYLLQVTESAWALGSYKLLTVGICVGLLFKVRHRIEGEIAAWCGGSIMLVMSVVWVNSSSYLDDPEQNTMAQPGLYGEQWTVLD